MSGSIQKRPNGSYAAVVDVRASARRCAACNKPAWLSEHRGDDCPRCGASLGQTHLERRQVWRTYKRRREAETGLKQMLRELDAGKDPGARRDVRLGEYLEDWLARRASKIRPRTLKRYRDLLEHYVLPALRDTQLVEVRRDDVQRALDAMQAQGLAPRTIGQARAVLAVAFRDAVVGELVERNPVAGTSVPKRERPDVAVLSAEHVRALLAEAEGSMWAVPLTIAAHSGARRSEVLALRWSDLDLDRGRLTIARSLHVRPAGEGVRVEYQEPKTRTSARTITMTRTLAERLRQHRAAQNERRLAMGEAWTDSDLVCDNGLGAPIYPDSMTTAFKRLARRAGLPGHARLHDLRHALAVTLAIEGVPLEAVSAILGHASAGFTLSVYRHHVDEMSQGAAEALERRIGGRQA